jgi:predicted PurR-regulated permease PerM
MADTDLLGTSGTLRKRIIDLAIQLGVLFALLSWCFDIIRPFVLIVIWAGIVAVALHPIFERLSGWLGGSRKLSATLLVLILIAILVVPAVLLTESLLGGAQALADAGELQIPPPPETVAGWPLVGPKIYDLWGQAANNLPAMLNEFTPQVKAVGAWLLETVTGTGVGLLQFIASFIIAGILLTASQKGRGATEKLVNRLVPRRGKEFVDLATGTVQNVAVGIVGVSILQTTLLSIGFVAIGLPAAGLAALVVLILCIIQVGPGLVVIPAIIYAFSSLDTGPAVIFTIWTVVMTLSDSVLKPLVFGRGAAVPTLVIFLGAIGGMVSYGIIGLFVGAVVLSLGYKLYMAWLDDAEKAVGDEQQA